MKTVLDVCKNKYIIYDDYAEMIITNKYGEYVATCLVDVEDIERLRKISWRYSTVNGYISASGSKKLHRFVANYNGRLYIDHINGNKFDNRKCNLRISDSEQSVQNRTTPISNKTGFRGIRIRKYVHVTKYQAYITHKKKQIVLGSFDTFEEAKKARVEAEKKYFGEYRRGDE